MASNIESSDIKRPDDVVITMAIRSPLCKARSGAFKDTRSDELLTEILKASLASAKIDPALVEDICVGTVLAPGPVYEARAAALSAGFPETTPCHVVNRLCASGLMAVTLIANQIRAGQIEIGLAVGSESMTAHPDTGAPPLSEEVLSCPSARDCTKPMGWTAENVADDFSVSRAEMDALAALSFRRAESAQSSGLFDREIVPLTVWRKDTKSGARERVVVDRDDGIRYGTTQAALGRIRSAFPQWGRGTTTGGNACQITDGAAAVLLMTRRRAGELGLRVLGRHATTVVTGVAPCVMGISPVYAIPMALKKAGLTDADVDLYEINEAFGSMYVYCLRKLNIDVAKVNVNGGAIALGHPHGCTGVRQIVTGLHELEQRGGKVLVTSMPAGTGLGAAAVFLRD